MTDQKPEHYRLFWAIPLPEEHQSMFAAMIEFLKQQTNGDAVKWIPKQNLHLTLRFIGETDTKKIKPMIEEVKNAVGSIHAFNLTFGKLMGFPPHNPHTLAVMLELTNELAQLVYQVEQALLNLGLPPETRPYVPHLTIGRLRGRRMPIVTELPIALPAILPVNQLILHRSQQTSQGSEYKELIKIILPK